MRNIIVAVLWIYMLPIGLSAQKFTNLSEVLAAEKDPVYLIDARVHSINDQGTVLGSLSSVHDPNSRQLFVLRKKGKEYQLTFHGVYPECEPVVINNQGKIAMNAKLDGAVNRQAWIFSSAGSDAPQRIFPQDDKSEIHDMEGGKVAITLWLSGLEDKTKSAKNPYKEKASAIGTIPQIASKGHLLDLKNGKMFRGGFPIADWYHLNSQITGFNKQGNYCGQSQGYTLGENVRSPYPFFADKDSVYRLIDGYQGKAIAMNNHDQVIGIWEHPLTGRGYGFYWDREIGKTSEYGWLDLLIAIPRAINNDGVVVGKRGDMGFVWHDNEFLDLKKTINLPKEWKVLDIVDINDQNEVIGIIGLEGKKQLFVADLHVGAFQ